MVKCLLARQSLRASVNVHGFSPEEPRKGLATFPCKLDRQATGGRDRYHYWQPCAVRLLHHLKRGSAAQEDEVFIQRQSLLQKRPSDQLIERVVAADILPHFYEIPLQVKERTGMKTARAP